MRMTLHPASLSRAFWISRSCVERLTGRRLPGGWTAAIGWGFAHQILKNSECNTLNVHFYTKCVGTLTTNAATLVFFAAATGTGIVASDFGFSRHISDFALFPFHHQRFHSAIESPVPEQFSYHPNGTIRP